MKKGTLPYRPDIDGIRAIAVGLVVIFHFELIPMGRAGFIGVDIFFVLSGYLITRIILTDIEARNFSLKQFYAARIRRLYPALLSVLMLYLVVGWFLFLPDLFKELAIESIFSQLYAVNFYFWREVNYFGLQAKQVPLLHMWSLAVEEQFYIFYPVFLLAIARFAKKALIPILFLTVFGSFALGWFASSWKPWAAFYLLPTRAWELGVGGLLAVLLLRNAPSVWFAQLAGWIGLGLIGIALAIYSPLIAFPGWFAALPVLGAVALVISGSAPQGPSMVSKGLSIKPMIEMGQISYPLYLVHWPVIIILAQSLPEVFWGMRALGLALSIALSWAIMRFIETPIRRKHILSTERQVVWSTAGISALAIGASAFFVFNEGQPNRFDPRVSQLLAYADDQPHQFKPCDWPAPSCSLGASGKQPSIVLFGDSHASAYATALDQVLTKADEAGELRFASACMPVLNMGGARCNDFTKKTLDTLVNDKTVNTVILASIWRQGNSKSGLIVDDKIIKGPALHAAFAENLSLTVERLRSSGKSVVLIEPLFATPNFVPQTLARNLAFGTDWPVDLPRQTHIDQFSFAQAGFDAAQEKGAVRINPLDQLCTESLCSATLKGTPLFTDNSHIRVGQSIHFNQLLKDALFNP